jgi:heme oxygenase
MPIAVVWPVTRGQAQILTRLNSETLAFHADMDDAVWIGLLGGELTLTRYVNRLMAVYGFESPIESALAYTPRLGAIIELRNRARSGLIAQDLIALGFSTSQVAQLPLCPIAPFAEPAEALGWMYVVQRSTLLHERTKRHIDARLPHLTRGTAYLSATDGRVSAGWNELGSILDTVIRDQLTADRVVRGAQDAFRRALEWFHSPEWKPAAAVDYSSRASAIEPDSLDDTD